MGKLTGKLGISLLIAMTLVSASVLFFEDSLTGLVSLLSQNLVQKIDNTGQSLRIGYLFSPKNLNPFEADPVIQSRLLDVYEGLVQQDENLLSRPALAISYGLVGDKEWHFYLRKGVKFHDGSDLDVADVLYSFDQARRSNNSVVAELNENIESVKQAKSDEIVLLTKKPDPLLLGRISKLPIVPEKFTDYVQPVGTGPYKLVDTGDLSDLKYQRNEQYWGTDLPYFPNLEIKGISGKNDRVIALSNGDIDFLVNVPPDAAGEIQDKGFEIATIPSLEVGFVMFDSKNAKMSNKSLRMAISKGLNKESFLDLAFGYAKTINQFIPNGVFGFNPQIKGFTFNQEEAEQDLAKEFSSFEKVKIEFYFPESLKLLGQYFKEQLVQIGIDVELKALTDADLQKALEGEGLSFYYLGWRHDSGDAISFLKQVIHSKAQGYGQYNGNNYKNQLVDSLIEKSEVNLDQEERLKDMQEVMRIITEQDMIGVPLFETESLFAFDKNLKFRPRVDSLVYPSNIKK